MRVLLCWLSYEAKTGAATGIRAPLSELPTRWIAVYPLAAWCDGQALLLRLPRCHRGVLLAELPPRLKLELRTRIALVSAVLRTAAWAARPTELGAREGSCTPTVTLEE